VVRFDGRKPEGKNQVGVDKSVASVRAVGREKESGGGESPLENIYQLRGPRIGLAKRGKNSQEKKSAVVAEKGRRRAPESQLGVRGGRQI